MIINVQFYPKHELCFGNFTMKLSILVLDGGDKKPWKSNYPFYIGSKDLFFTLFFIFLLRIMFFHKILTFLKLFAKSSEKVFLQLRGKKLRHFHSRRKLLTFAEKLQMGRKKGFIESINLSISALLFSETFFTSPIRSWPPSQGRSKSPGIRTGSSQKQSVKDQFHYIYKQRNATW